MEFLTLTFSDFKSFVGQHQLDFRKYPPGLYFLRGENRAEPDMGSNGAAKSTLMDVINWVLFGTSMRGTRSPELVSWWTSDNPVAKLRVRIEGKIWTIRRTYKPTTLTVTRKGRERPVTQEQLDDLVGLTPTTLENSILMGQYTRLFFDLKPREKMNVFSSLVDLDYWVDCADRASSTLHVLEADAQEVQQRIDTATARMEEISRTIKDLEKGQLAGADLAASEMKEIEQTRRELRSSYNKIGVRVKVLREELEVTQRKRRTELKKLKRLDVDIKTGREQLSNSKSALQVEKAKLIEFGRQEHSLKSATGSCPTCGQRISATHRRKELEKLSQRSSKIEERVKKLEEESGKLDETVEELATCWLRTNELTDKLGATENQQKLDLSSLGNEMNSLKLRIDDIDTHADRLRRRGEEDVRNLERQQRRLAKVRKERAGHRKELRELERTIEQVRLWVRGFKEIRLYELEEILTSLEVEINSYLVDLGMERWSVHLDVERETKRGRISRGFQTMVDPGKGSGKRSRPWEVWSGGEGQRLRLAGTLALSNLILRQVNRRSNIQIWDESLIFLSGSGREDMLELLQETAHREGKQIWVVDQSELSYPFNGVLTVVKDEHGSRLVT